MRTLALAALSLALLVACAQPGEITPVSGGDTPTGADQPVTSDMVAPAGGDLRIGQPWYLVGTSLSSVEMPPVVTVTFEADRVGGQGPVNSWSAEYTAGEDGSLALGKIATTLMAGSEEAMRAEEAYMSLLGTVDGYTAVEAGELYLFDGLANVLVYSATPQVAVEPTISDSTEAVAEDVIGMTEEKAQSTVEEAGLVWRVAARDGEQYALTEDYVVTRVNATIIDGVVTETWVG